MFGWMRKKKQEPKVVHCRDCLFYMADVCTNPKSDYFGYKGWPDNWCEKGKRRRKMIDCVKCGHSFFESEFNECPQCEMDSLRSELEKTRTDLSLLTPSVVRNGIIRRIDQALSGQKGGE